MANSIPWPISPFLSSLHRGVGSNLTLSVSRGEGEKKEVRFYKINYMDIDA